MYRIDQEEDKYRVILHHIGEDTVEERTRFCQEISKNYGIPASLLKKIVNRCPIVIKKDLAFKKAEMLAITFKSFGASVSVERKRVLAPIVLEFQGEALSLFALESSCLRKSPGGQWHVIGRVKNISHEELFDAWVLVQLFDELGELITFEEASLPINPLPPGRSAPFKVIFEKNLSINKISIGFKNASGHPIPAADRMEKREWVEVNIPEIEKREQPISAGRISEEALPTPEPETPIFLERAQQEREEEDLERGSEEMSLSGIEEGPLTTAEETEEENEDLTLSLFEGDDPQEEQRFEIILEQEPHQPEAPSILKDEKSEREENLQPDLSSEDRMGNIPEVEPDTPFQEGLTQVLQEHPAISEKEEKEESLFYPWMEEFRKWIEVYHQRHQDAFTIWLENLMVENGVESPYHSLLTILTYARFNQDNHSAKALENTQKVFKFILQENLSFEEIPSLEGTSFFLGEAWRELFFRAIPKLQEVAHRILEKRQWDAQDLDRLIRIIPHISDRNSRWALRSIREGIPEVLRIDFSNLPVYIGGSLYRVASRLGIVNPLFDYYQGRNSMGDLKIQSFARAAFPDDPVKIEEPMTRLGMEEEKGHCFPVEPQCEGCSFDAFCPKLFFDSDPSEKGMIVR
ncbi:MAG: hypothetical protein QME90_01930 [Thermodesulfobacteriota bacterium]|nr:hypothetical protein [Thermodesulfobacteriota bacterium]